VSLDGFRLLAASWHILQDERDRLIVMRAEAGVPVSVLAREAGLSRRAVYDILKRAGKP